jgi:uncharacterized membrane protein
MLNLLIQGGSILEKTGEEQDLVKKKWKAFLAERSETIVDGVFGLVLGLGAYSLTGFEMSGTDDVVLAISYFALTFFLVCMFWWNTSKGFSVAEYSDVLMGINFLFIILLALMPFFLRLLLVPDPVIQNMGLTLFPIVIGGLLLSSLFANILIMHKNRDIPEEVSRDLKRSLFILPLMSSFFFLSLLIPPNATVHMVIQNFMLPEPFMNYSFRVAFWWITIFLALILGIIVEAVQKRRLTQDVKAQPAEWRITLTKKSRAISDTVYGLALGLCAYSLTDYVLGSFGDIILALSYFILTFLLILNFWSELYRCFAMVKYFDDTLVVLNLLVAACVTLLPFSLRLAMAPEAAVQTVGMTFFPLNMVAAGLTSSAFVLLTLRRRTVDVPRDDLMELQRFTIGIPAFAFIYILSLWIPPDAAIPTQVANFIPDFLSVLKTLPLRVFVWWFSFIPFFIVGTTAEFLQEWRARKKPVNANSTCKK